MKVLALIPARSGSVRIPNKNLCRLAGRTLVELAADAAHRSRRVSYVAVSTDAREFACGFDWIERPAALSTGYQDSLRDVVRDGLLQMEARHGVTFDLVVTLQPAVPLRTGAIIDAMIDAMVEQGCRGAITGVPVVPWLWSQYAGAASNAWSPGPYPLSQDCHGDRWQEINSVQIATREVVLARQRWDLPLLVHLLPPWAAVDIDTPHDLQRAQIVVPFMLEALEQDPGDGQRYVSSLNQP